MALFGSIITATISWKTIENIDQCNPNLLLYKLITTTNNGYQSGFVSDQQGTDN